MQRTITNPIFDDKVTFLKTSEETNREYTLLEIELAPKGGNPLHFHTCYTETFTAKEGQLEVKQEGGKSKILQPGESYKVAIMEPHGFHNPNDDKITFHVKLEPGQKGFEDSIRIMYGLAHDGLADKRGLPKDLATNFILAEMGNMESPAFIFKLLSPLGKYMAKKAIKKGKKKELLEMYCK
ncbi:cupin domain-containing protein [Litoribacter alkaliphilus]|uniref:Cupin domain-containing protein n=1 Tax=Litoribacter ruber TaxID=702568 RepID=A0AAP2CEW1_9BACT|nr:cupin domain-containing protein [Litoribacter alkaliphilus]MBS9523143.1 cupin domain-containing protein [Litoribacter alkaliphilus]